MHSRRAATGVLVAAAAAIASWGPRPEAAPDLAAEVALISARPFHRVADRPIVVVTGSSSVRLWPDPAAAFPAAQVVNTGFGGATTADVLRYLPVVVTRYRPDRVVLHAGDNDLASGRSPGQVLADTRLLVTRTRAAVPDVGIVLVAAKPSPARWYLRNRYLALNRGYRDLAGRLPGVAFADMWRQLIGTTGYPDPSWYTADGLHLSDAGYRRWSALLARFAPHR